MRMIFAALAAFAVAVASPAETAHATHRMPTYHPQSWPCFSVPRQRLHRRPQVGMASFYNEHHHRTANGEHFNPYAMTAASRTLPFGTHVRVTRLDTGDSVVVRINDYGPNKRLHGRVIDLTPIAARRLGFLHDGLTRVRVDVL